VKDKKEFCHGVRLGLGVCVWLSLCSACLVARFLLDLVSSLAKRKGQVAIAVKHLNTGESTTSMRMRHVHGQPCQIARHDRGVSASRGRQNQAHGSVTLREEDKVPAAAS